MSHRQQQEAASLWLLPQCLRNGSAVLYLTVQWLARCGNARVRVSRGGTGRGTTSTWGWQEIIKKNNLLVPVFKTICTTIAMLRYDKSINTELQLVILNMLNTLQWAYLYPSNDNFGEYGTLRVEEKTRESFTDKHRHRDRNTHKIHYSLL